MNKNNYILKTHNILCNIKSIGIYYLLNVENLGSAVISNDAITLNINLIFREITFGHFTKVSIVWNL